MSIRLRIALLSAILTAVILAGIGAGVYYTLRRSMNQEIDNRLSGVVANVANHADTVRSSDGRLFVAIPDLDPLASPGLYIQVTHPDGTGVSQAPDLKSDYMPLSQDVSTEKPETRP